MNEILKKSEPKAVEHPVNSGIFTCYISADILLNNLKLPNIQRELDSKHIEKLQVKLVKEFETNKYFNFGIFDLCYFNHTLYLLNGQHRYGVLQKIVDEHPNITIQLKIKQVSSENEMNDYFRIVNDSKQSIIYKNSDFQLIINGLRRHINDKYGDYLSRSKKPHKPHINLDMLIQEIIDRDIINKFNIQTDVQLIYTIEKLNDYYRSIQYNLELWKSWKIPDIQNLLEKTINKSPLNPLFLGIYPKFEWLDRIAKHLSDEIDYNLMPHYWRSYRSRKISTKKRMQVWRKRAKSMDHLCFVCHSYLNIENFECGHVVSVFLGGRY